MRAVITGKMDLNFVLWVLLLIYSSTSRSGVNSSFSELFDIFLFSAVQILSSPMTLQCHLCNSIFAFILTLALILGKRNWASFKVIVKLLCCEYSYVLLAVSLMVENFFRTYLIKGFKGIYSISFQIHTWFFFIFSI